jgi:hypothetical protein
MTGFTVPQITYEKWHNVDIEFDPIVSSEPGCPVSYYLVNDQGDSTTLTEKFDVTMTNADKGHLKGVID